jgi:putative FmdB family regulatory protein
MTIYDYRCPRCLYTQERYVAMEYRDHEQRCFDCGGLMERQLAAPMGKIAGQVAKGGGADRLLAESLGCTIGELPPPLRTRQEDCNG